MNKLWVLGIAWLATLTMTFGVFGPAAVSSRSNLGVLVGSAVVAGGAYALVVIGKKFLEEFNK